MDENIIRNTARLCGIVSDTPRFSHAGRGESFYTFPLTVSRLSGAADTVNVIVRQELMESVELTESEKVCVAGELRSFNNKSGVGHRLIISVFARTLSLGGHLPFNQIQLSGILCKTPTLRHTPLGREICDIILAVNRRYGRADYLPCIAWGAVAQQVSEMPVGSRLTVEGRIQSRTYTKNTDGILTEHIAYEVSIMRPADIEEFLI